MYDHGPKKEPPDKIAPGVASTSAADRRDNDRHVFTASAQVIELSSGARFSARTTDLGPGGCFIDMMLPFPVGSKVRVNIRKDARNFETDGFVVYSQDGLGMGIAFDAMEPHHRESLDNWLTDLNGDQMGPLASSLARAPQDAGANRRGEISPAVIRLVQLMIGKGILTEAEGASVLYNPLL